jgi:hypothetical protein
MVVVLWRILVAVDYSFQSVEFCGMDMVVLVRLQVETEWLESHTRMQPLKLYK